MQTPWLIEGMRGLGDNLYQRAVLREVVKSRAVYLDTPWPQIYADLPIRCVKARTTLRTQAKNAERPWRWHAVPGLVDHHRLHYVNHPGTMLEALCAEMRVKAGMIDFSGPPVPRLVREPYIVVRPVTNRTEWQAGSRNPKPEYVARAVDALRQRFRVVSVADISPPHETVEAPLPYADEVYHRGELSIEQLLAMVAGASAVVGGVGWLAPMAVAYRVPMLLIFGGWGMHNGPARIFDPRMDTSRIHQALPDRFCLCGSRDHACDKTISRLDEHLERFQMELAASRSAPVAA